MRGRKPKPTKLKLLTGDTGKRAAKAVPMPESGIPECPPALTGEAAAEWARLTEELLSLGLLSRIDRAALAGYCAAWQTFTDASAKLEEQGLVATTARGNVIQNPYLGIRNTALKLLAKFAAEFGMTPSSRSRINVSAPDKEVDEFEEFLKA